MIDFQVQVSFVKAQFNVIMSHSENLSQNSIRLKIFPDIITCLECINEENFEMETNLDLKNIGPRLLGLLLNFPIIYSVYNLLPTMRYFEHLFSKKSSNA